MQRIADKQGWLGVLGLSHAPLWVDQAKLPHGIAQNLVYLHFDPKEFGRFIEQFSGHAEVLRPLPGKHEDLHRNFLLV
jgi:hypothetical protein